MSFAEMMKEATKLTAEERQELMNLLEAIEESRTPEFKRDMAAILDDPDPNRWVEIKDWDTYLDNGESHKSD